MNRQPLWKAYRDGYTLALLGAVFAILLYTSITGPYLPLFYYDEEFHRSALSAMTGALATVFALIASTSILMFQQISAHSPTSLRFFPTGDIVTIVLRLGALLVADGCLLMVRTAPSSVVAVLTNVVMLLHVVATYYVVWFVYMSLEWLNPSFTIRRLKDEAPLCKTEDQRADLIDALSELSSNFTSKGHASHIKPLIGAYRELVRTYAAVPTDEPTLTENGRDSRQRLISSIGQLSVQLSHGCLESFLSDTVPLFSDLLIEKRYAADGDLRERVSRKINRLVSTTLANRQEVGIASFLRKLGSQLRAGGWRPFQEPIAELFLGIVKEGVKRRSHLLATTAASELEAFRESAPGDVELSHSAALARKLIKEANE